MNPSTSMGARMRLALLLAAALAGVSGWAQPQPQPQPISISATPPLATAVTGPATRWVTVRAGKVQSIAAHQSNGVFALDDSGAVWRLPNAALQAGDFGVWVPQPGNFVRLRATQDNSLWGIDGAQRLYRWVGAQWTPFADRVRDVAATPDGVVMLLLTDGSLQTPYPEQQSTLPPSSEQITQLLSDEHGLPWLLYASGRALRWGAGGWQQVSPQGTPLAELAIGGDGTVVAVTRQGQLLRRVPLTGAWQDPSADTALPADIAHVALDSQGLPWVSSSSGALWAQRWAEPLTAVTAKPPALFTRLLSWRQVGGASSAVGLGTDGSVLSLSKEGAVWQWKSDNKWSSLGGNFRDLAVGSGGAAWAVDARGVVSALQRGLWQPLPGKVQSVAAGPGNIVWSISATDDLQWWNAATQQWMRVQTLPKGVLQLAMGPRAEPWLIDAEGMVQTLQRQPGEGWQTIPGITANSLAVGPEGTVYATQGSDQSIYWLDKREMRWKPATGKATAIAVGPNGAPWIIAPGHLLMASGRFLQDEAARHEAQRLATTPAAPPVLTITAGPLPTLNKPLVYKPLQMADLVFQDIGIGSNGAVFALAGSGNVYCFSNPSQRFLLASLGQAKRIAVTAAGAPWLLNTSGSVTRLERGAWQLVPDFIGQDIAIGPDGMVWALDRQGDAYRFVVASHRFERVPVATSDAPIKAKRIAGANANVHWLVTDTNQLLRCEKGDCRLQLIGVQDVAVAPDNTAFVLDLLGTLRRYNPAAKQFEKQNGSGIAMAVGPQGLPWLISAEGKISYAGLFNPLSKTVNTDSCPAQFSQAPAPIDPPNAALRVSDIRAILPPGGSLKLQTALAVNGRPLALGEANITLTSTAAHLQLKNDVLLVAADAPLGSTITATLNVCPKQVVGTCSTSHVAIQVATVPLPLPAPSATAGNAQASIAFTALQVGGGLPIRSYVVTANPGGRAGTGTASPIVVTGLQNGTAYTFSIQAVNSVGTGPASPPSNVVIPASIPDAPSITSVQAGNQQVAVAFTPPSVNGGMTVTGYVLTASPGGQSISGAGSPLTVTGLTNGTAYTFTVRAVNALGQGPASLPSSVVTPASIPDAPSIASVQPGNQQVVVAFAPPLATGGIAVTGYVVTANPGGQSATGAGSPLTVVGLSNGTAYTFTVRAINALGQGPASLPSSAVTPATVPGAPAITGVVAGNQQVSVAFAAPVESGGMPITSYVVSASPGGLSVTGVGSPLTVTGLSNGTPYSFRVRAINALGQGLASAPSTPATPQAPIAPPGAPINVFAVAGDAQATISFAAPASNGGAPITSYSVTTNPGGASAIATTSPINVFGLVNGQSYNFTVQATNNAGTGPASIASNTVTPQSPISPPDTPGPVGGTPMGAGQIQVDFGLSPSDGGSPITFYTVTASPGGTSASGPTTPILLTGLPPGTYTVVVTANNAAGTSAPSSASAPVSVP